MLVNTNHSSVHIWKFHMYFCRFMDFLSSLQQNICEFTSIQRHFFVASLCYQVLVCSSFSQSQFVNLFKVLLLSVIGDISNTGSFHLLRIYYILGTSHLFFFHLIFPQAYGVSPENKRSKHFPRVSTLQMAKLFINLGLAQSISQVFSRTFSMHKAFIFTYNFSELQKWSPINRCLPVYHLNHKPLNQFSF